MHYTLLSSLVFFISTVLPAQSFRVFDPKAGATLSNHDVVNCGTSAAMQADLSYFVKNLSASTQTLSVRKYEDQLNRVSAGDEAQAFFCTGAVCYVPAVMSASFALNPGDSMDLKLSLQEASVAGTSTLRYKVSHAAASESLEWTIHYTPATGLAGADALPVSISAVYPNPSGHERFVSVRSSAPGKARLLIYQLPGALVSTEEIALPGGGEAAVRVGAPDLPAGTYLLVLEGGAQRVSKTFTVCHP